MKILCIFCKNKINKRCFSTSVLHRKLSRDSNRFENYVGFHGRPFFQSRNLTNNRYQGYKFSKQRLFNQENCTTRRCCVWAQNSKYIESYPKFKNLEALQKNYGYFEITRKASTSSVKDPKPAIKEPNSQEKNIKKEDGKKEEKKKKPAMILSENSSTNQATIEEIRKVFRNKWGVKLTDHTAVTNDADSTKNNTSPKISKEVEPKKNNKLRLALITSSDEPMENYFVKRPPKKTNLEKSTIYMETVDESTELDDEHYVPPELQEKGEVAAWKRAASNSKRRIPKDDETTPAAKLQEVESIFIRPEPPAPKLDVKSSFYTQKSHFSTYRDSKINDQSNTRESLIDTSRSEPSTMLPITIEKSKSSSLLSSLLSWFNGSSPDGNKALIANERKLSDDEITKFIKKPKIVEVSKLPRDLRRNNIEGYKFDRLNSIETGEVWSIYQTKNYDSLKIDEITERKEFKVLSKNFEDQTTEEISETKENKY